MCVHICTFTACGCIASESIVASTFKVSVVTAIGVVGAHWTAHPVYSWREKEGRREGGREGEKDFPGRVILVNYKKATKVSCKCNICEVHVHTYMYIHTYVAKAKNICSTKCKNVRMQFPVAGFSTYPSMQVQVKEPMVLLHIS